MQDLDKFKNEMNLSGKNVYVGHRYKPKMFGEWDNTQIYEPLSIVQYQGNSYTSRQYVPVGVEITNEEYWASTGNYNAQVEQYRQEVREFGNRISNNELDIDNANTQLAQMHKYPIKDNETGVVDEYYQYGNVLRYGAKSGEDSTEAITHALNYCNTTRTTLYFPNGQYLDTKERIVKTNVKGENMFNTRWVYTKPTGTFLTFDGVYRVYLKAENIRITNENQVNNANGIKVVYGLQNSEWGASLRTNNVEVYGFGGVVLHLIDAFNCYFEHSRFAGIKDQSTILYVESVNSVSNVNTFKQSVLTNGKIGIRTFNIIDLHFDGCTLEAFQLFMNNEQTNMDSFISFENSHFENYNIGIVNAKINLDTLELVEPVTNKVPLRFFRFTNGIEAKIPEQRVDPIVNPEASPGDERDYYFYFTNGLEMEGNGNYQHAGTGRVYRTREGLMINTTTKTLRYLSDSQLEVKWTIHKDFKERPQITATLNTMIANLNNDGYELKGVIAPVIEVNGNEVTVQLFRPPNTPVFTTKDSVSVDLIAVGRWR